MSGWAFNYIVPENPCPALWCPQVTRRAGVCLRYSSPHGVWMPELSAEVGSWVAKTWLERMVEIPWVELFWGVMGSVIKYDSPRSESQVGVFQQSLDLALKETQSGECYCVLFPSEVFYMAKVILDGFWLVFNFKCGERGCYLESPLCPLHWWKEYTSALAELPGLWEWFLSHLEIAEQFPY